MLIACSLFLISNPHSSAPLASRTTMALPYPVAAAPFHYFYPLRSEPATSLVLDVPPWKDLTLLLLGCGDPGNILFTTFGEEKNGIFLIRWDDSEL
jgi:hypothetical protein